MKNCSKPSKPRSYIFDVPTRSHIHSPLDEDDELIINKALTSRGTSRISQSKPISRSNSLLPEETTQDVSNNRLDFCMKFLPYIYAQTGYNQLRTILSCFKQKHTTESLPVNRKVSELDIFAEEEKKVNQELQRNRSMEIERIKLL